MCSLLAVRLLTLVGVTILVVGPSNMGLVMRKPAFFICENKDADQLRSNSKLFSAFVFAIRIVHSLYYLNPKFQASTEPSSVAVQPGLSRTWSKTPKTGFLTTRLI